jgi:hypothetical protein
MDKNKLKQELKAKLKKEMSMTGTGASVTSGVGAGVATKYAFAKKKDGNKIAKDYIKTFGGKLAPSIPNRPSKAMDYKELWEEINEDASTDEILTYLQAAKQNGTLSPDAQEVFLQWMNTPGASREEIIKVLRNLTGTYLNEGYAQFRNSTKTRTKPEQFHQAVKEVKKKVNEINRLFEYMDRLKSELNEGEELKYKKYTERSIQQIKESTKQLFFKSTKLK